MNRLCRPFVSFIERRVEIKYPSMALFVQEKLKIYGNSPYKSPDADLAEKCISILSQEEYTKVTVAAGLLRRHLLPPGLLTNVQALQIDEPLSYEYAALYWQNHVAAVPEAFGSSAYKDSQIHH